MKWPRVPLRAQYAATTCGLVALAVVILITGYLAFSWSYDTLVRRDLPASVEAELKALEVSPNPDYSRWQAIYDKYHLDPPPAVQAGLLISVGLIVLALTGFLGIRLADRFGRPVAAVALAARRVACGDLTARADVPSPVNAELANLVMDFNAMAGHIERSEKERRMTTAAIAHELRTPLTVMRGRLQGMLDGLFEANRQEVSRLIGQTDLLARIVEDLRTVTLAEAGRLELRKEAVELRALAAESIEMMSPRLASSGLRVELHGTPVLVQADRHRLTQVICAFLDNAVRYAPHTDVVDISVGSDAGMARIAVADRGPGLPEGTTELAFNGFWRAEESRSRASGGSGLGLAVVQAIASAHGAKARSHHRDGGGMVFEILIPLES
jgi:signal transduction histidine kinase